MATTNKEPGTSLQPPDERSEIDKFIDPRPGEDGTPDVIVAKAPGVMPNDIKQRLVWMAERNAAIAAARGIVSEAEGAVDTTNEEPAGDTDPSDEIMVAEPISSVQEDLGYRQYTKRSRGSRGGKKVQAARARRLTSAQQAARAHEAATERLGHTPKIDPHSLDDPLLP